jgi:hypothetical protein
MIHAIGDALVVISFIEFGAFVVFYALFSPWWRSPAGRSVMMLVAVLAATLGLACLTILFGFQWPARELLRTAIFGAVALAAGQLLITHVGQKLAYWREKRQNPEGGQADEELPISTSRLDDQHPGGARCGDRGE